MCGAPACVLWGHVMCVCMQYDVWCACMCVVGACDVCVCVQYDVWCACMCVVGACDVCACSMMCGAPACVL